jgi:hypothetical protein
MKKLYTGIECAGFLTSGLPDSAALYQDYYRLKR